MTHAPSSDSIAAALRSIVERDEGPRTGAQPGPLAVIAGKDHIGDDEFTAGGVVTVSEKGVYLWHRVEYGRDYPIVADRLDGLFDFMRLVMWPRLVSGWNYDRLMAEPVWNAAEKAAIDAWELSKAELRRVIHKDHTRGLKAYPELLALYSAVHRLDAAALRLYTGDLPGHLAGINSVDVQTLARAIEEGDRALVATNRNFLTLRAAMIAFIDSENYGWQSDRQAASLSRTQEHSQVVTALAQRRYAAQFLDVCLSHDMLDIKDKFFADAPEGDREAYCAQVRAFVGGKLETLSQGSFYK